jgi:hypothetical protein
MANSKAIRLLSPITLFSALLLSTGAAHARTFGFGYDYAQPLTDTIRLQNTQRIVEHRMRSGNPVREQDWLQYRVCQRMRAFTQFDRDCNQFLY